MKTERADLRKHIVTACCCCMPASRDRTSLSVRRRTFRNVLSTTHISTCSLAVRCRHRVVVVASLYRAMYHVVVIPVCRCASRTNNCRIVATRAHLAMTDTQSRNRIASYPHKQLLSKVRIVGTHAQPVINSQPSTVNFQPTNSAPRGHLTKIYTPYVRWNIGAPAPRHRKQGERHQRT